MPPRTVLLAAFALAAAGCAREPEGRRYALHGQILRIEPERRQVLIRHDDIPGFMPAMTMTFSVADPALLNGKAPGDLVSATLVVSDTTAHLTTLDKTGHAPLAGPNREPPVAAPPLLGPGDPVPEQTLTDHQGRTRRLGEWRGHALALTFIYTRCPMPEFCPRMDRLFAEVQQRLASDPRLASHVRLLSISFDPEHDTPPVLAQHARRLGADARLWTFAVPPATENAAFAAQFGIVLERPAGDPLTITHNLRTAVVDPQGRIVRIYSGNEWSASQLLADLLTALSAS